MEQKAEKILKKYLKKNSRAVLALSGGSDSVYLLHLLLDLRKKYPFEIIVAHINHKLRGKESDLDEKFVEKLAKKHHLTFECTSLQKKSGKGNLEELCRDCRYSFLEKVRKKHRARLILTAHHRGDNVETALFNLARGSYLNGLTGMETFSPDKNLLRPLLAVTKEEILSYLKTNKIPFRNDKSNLDDRFSRNRIRNNIIPELIKINPNFEKSFLVLMGSLAETAAHLEGTATLWIKKNGGYEGIFLEKFLALTPVLQKNIIAEVYLKTHGNIRKFNRKHLARVLEVLKKNRSGLKKEFGDGYMIEIKRGRLGRKIISIVRKLKNPQKQLQ